MIGRTLGRFRIVAPLGKGGMATVWRAHDPVLGRDLALKLLGESLAQSDEARRRFRREAHIAGRLDHPAIVAVYDSGETDGATWIAMALVEGETLAERLGRSLLPVSECLAVGRTVADALAYAHEQGAVHRDVSARNVMLGRDGRVFLLDFGLALARDTSRVTSSSATVGTAPYMAPEILSGGHATASSDVYGLGVVLYEALTGGPPYSGATPAAMISAVLHETLRPPHEWRPEIPPALDALVTRCLARDPRARGGAAELARDLRRIEDGGRDAAPVEAPSSTLRSRLAERLADRSGPTYLAVTPFEASASDADTLADTRAFADDLTGAVAAAVSSLRRLHVVPMDAAPADRSAEALRGFARAHGAQLLLFGDVRRSGTRLRVTYALRDPEAGLQIAGDALEGSALDPFELEGRVLRSLRGVLPGQDVDTSAVTREHRRDPAATEHFRQALRDLERHDHEPSVDAAIEQIQALIATEGESAPLQAALSRAMLFKYDLTRRRSWEVQAAEAIARAVALAPEAPETLLALGDVHRVAGRFAEAERHYGLALAQRPDFFEAQLGHARALEGLGRLDEADAECESATASRPGDWRGHVLLGRLRYSRGRFEEAIMCWQRVTEIVPDNALVARNLGSALAHLDRFDEAVASFERAIDLRPDASVYSNLGTALFYLERYQDASEAFRRSAAMLPSDPIMWGNLGNSLRFTPGYEEESRRALERAVDLMREQLDRDPGSSESWGRMAGWLVNLARADEARAAVQSAMERGPEDVHTLVHAGHVRAQLGDVDEAVCLFRRAVERGFSRETLRRSPDLQGLRGHPAMDELLSD